MIRRGRAFRVAAGVMVAVGGATTVGAGAGVAAVVPDGPHLAFISLANDRLSRLNLESVDPSGSNRMSLVRGSLRGGRGPLPFFGPSWSPDGARLAFSAAFGRHSAIYLVNSDGSGRHAIGGTRGGTNPVFSPDGHELAFARSRYRASGGVEHRRFRFYSSTTTWIVDLESGEVRRLTRWRNGLDNTPTSFTPDGSALAMTKSDTHLGGPRAVLTQLDGSGSRVLLREASEPVVSPDGLQVALISYRDRDVVHADEEDYIAGDLYTVSIDGTTVSRLTRTEDIEEAAPSWDPSGQRIAYTQVKASTGFVPALDQLFPYGNSIMQVNADGTCRERVLSFKRVAIYGVAWQPGSGHEAGRIVC